MEINREFVAKAFDAHIDQFRVNLELLCQNENLFREQTKSFSLSRKRVYIEEPYVFDIHEIGQRISYDAKKEKIVADSIHRMIIKKNPRFFHDLAGCYSKMHNISPDIARVKCSVTAYRASRFGIYFELQETSDQKKLFFQALNNALFFQKDVATVMNDFVIHRSTTLNLSTFAIQPWYSICRFFTRLTEYLTHHEYCTTIFWGGKNNGKLVHPDRLLYAVIDMDKFQDACLLVIHIQVSDWNKIQSVATRFIDFLVDDKYKYRWTSVMYGSHYSSDAMRALFTRLQRLI